MIELHNGDCLKLMRDIPDKSVDCVITDPPYVLDTHGGGNRKQWKNIHDNFIKDISVGFDYENVFTEFLRICKKPNIIIFCSNKQISKFMTWFEARNLSTTLLCWHKKNYCPFGNGKHISDVEFMVYVRGKGAFWNNDIDVKLKSKVYTDNWRVSKKQHPSQKSLEVINHIIELHTLEDDIILDPFMGSGTTGVACKNTNRNFIGMELDKHYFEIAKERIEGQSDLFAG